MNKASRLLAFLGAWTSLTLTACPQLTPSWAQAPDLPAMHPQQQGHMGTPNPLETVTPIRTASPLATPGSQSSVSNEMFYKKPKPGCLMPDMPKMHLLESIKLGTHVGWYVHDGNGCPGFLMFFPLEPGKKEAK